MNKAERLKVYEAFFHKINMALLTHNQEKIQNALELIDAWSYAHRFGNGEPTEFEQKRMVEKVIARMGTF